LKASLQTLIVFLYPILLIKVFNYNTSDFG
jgi:hypothetical protein